MTLFTLAVTLFLIMDPVGNISSFLTMVQDIPARRRLMILMREMGIVLALMIGFNYIGEGIFQILELSQTTVSLMSGVILFLSALLILFPTSSSPRANLPAGEPFIVPLAVPFIAGPSLLANIMLFAHTVPEEITMVFAILAAWVAAFLVLLAAPLFKRILGENGLMAAERLLAMVLVMLAIQRLLEGIHLFVGQCKV